MQHRNALLALHFGAVLFGLSGIFGKLALTTPLMIVFGRAVFAMLALAAFSYFIEKASHLSSTQRLRLAVVGLLLGGHWWTFFIAIKTSGVAIATLGFASFPAFTVLLEALLFKERIRWAEWSVVGLVSLGLVLVAPDFDWQNANTQGLAWAVFSGFLFALVSVANRAVTAGIGPAQAAYWQNLGIVVVCMPWVITQVGQVRALDWLWIALLGLLCTALAHSLFVASLRVLNARSASVVFALEPVYGILFAWWLFNEKPSLIMAFGGTLILLATVLSARLSKHAAKVSDLT